MKDLDLFKMALELDEEWFVVKSEFIPKDIKLDISLDFRLGEVLPCPECSLKSMVHDTEGKTWRHLNFFQHEASLHARVPRIRCQEQGIKMIEIPRALEQSGFTLLFKDLILSMADIMPVNAIAKLIGKTDKRLWRIIIHYVNRDLEQQDLSKVRRIGVDKTSTKPSHNYVSFFVEMDTNKVVFVTEGKKSSLVQAFKDHLLKHRGDQELIWVFSCDMSPAFIAGIKTQLRTGNIAFDHLPVMKLLNKSLEEVHRQEQAMESMLKAMRYVWLKNRSNLIAKQRMKLDSLSNLKLKTARAYGLKLVFQKAFPYDGRLGVYALKKWYFGAIRLQLEPIKHFARILKEHWDGVARWFECKLNNVLLDSLNSLVQAAKARASGYHSTTNFKTMIYMIAGKVWGGYPYETSKSLIFSSLMHK